MIANNKISKIISRVRNDLALSKKQTTLIVAHRPSTIQQADRILVMHHGRIVEQGTHKELMALENVYFRLNQLLEKTASRHNLSFGGNR